MTTLEVSAEVDRDALEALGLEIERLARRHGLTAAFVVRPRGGSPG